MIKYLIGIDAGGTKTKAIAYDEYGNILSTSITGPGSAAVVPVFTVWNNVSEAIKKVIDSLDKNKYQLTYIQMGLSAFSILDDVTKIEEEFSKKYNVGVSIESDTLIACHSILKNKYQNGVVALAGTGIAIFGINGSNTCLIGGWGHIIRELGSAYAAVHHFALGIIDQMENGLELTKIQNDFLNVLKENDIKDLKHLFYYHSKDQIASFVTFIKDYALKGNIEAKKILEEEGKSLALQVLKAINKLKLKDDYVIGLRGGFAQKQNNDIVNGFKEILKENNIFVEIINDLDDPAIGTYYLARLKNKI